MKTEEQMRALLVRSRDALADCYDVAVWPAIKGSPQLTVLKDLRHFLAEPKVCVACLCTNEPDSLKCDDCGRDL